ncbi:unnamed protein product [Hapterophycus canaliculatus]
MTAARRPGSPPWGLSEYRNNVGEKMHCILRPKTRSEMLRSRRENAVSFARGQLDKRGACSMPVPVTDGWWKLAEGYRENPLEDLASSPRFQRYIRRRARARAAEGPDPFGTHQVRLRGPSKAWAEKISLADPPPPDAEAYFAPKRTVKHFTDEFFEWKARLISHGDLDKRGKSKKRVTLDECAPPYSSLCSSFTGCSIDPGNNIRSASQAKAVFKASAPHLLERPSAAEVARRAHNKRRTMWKEILAATAKKPHLTCDGYDGSAGFDGCGDGMEGNGSSGNRSRSSGDSRPCPSLASSACSTDPVGKTWGKVEMRPPSAPPESNRRRYSRLCGQG